MCPCRLLGDAGHLMGSTVNELLPPDAQIHLLNPGDDPLAITPVMRVPFDHATAHTVGLFAPSISTTGPSGWFTSTSMREAVRPDASIE